DRGISVRDASVDREVRRFVRSLLFDDANILGAPLEEPLVVLEMDELGLEDAVVVAHGKDGEPVVGDLLSTDDRAAPAEELSIGRRLLADVRLCRHRHEGGPSDGCDGDPDSNDACDASAHSLLLPDMRHARLANL